MKLKTLLFIILIIFLGFILIPGNSDGPQNKNKEGIIIEKNFINNNENNSNEIEKIYVDNPSKENIESNQEKDKTEVKFKCPTPTRKYDDMFLSNLGQDTSLVDVTYIPNNLEELSLTSATREHL